MALGNFFGVYGQADENSWNLWKQDLARRSNGFVPQTQEDVSQNGQKGASFTEATRQPTYTPSSSGLQPNSTTFSGDWTDNTIKLIPKTATGSTKNADKWKFLMDSVGVPENERQAFHTFVQNQTKVSSIGTNKMLDSAIDKSQSFWQEPKNNNLDEVVPDNSRSLFNRIISPLSWNRLTAGTADALVKGEGLGGAIHNLGDAVSSMNPAGQGNEKGEFDFHRVLNDAGVKPGEVGKSSDPNIKPTTQFDANLSRYSIAVMGLMGDIFLDPLSYATHGLSSLIKGSGMALDTLGKSLPYLKKVAELHGVTDEVKSAKDLTSKVFDTHLQDGLSQGLDTAQATEQAQRAVDSADAMLNFKKGKMNPVMAHDIVRQLNKGKELSDVELSNQANDFLHQFNTVRGVNRPVDNVRVGLQHSPIGGILSGIGHGLETSGNGVLGKVGKGLGAIADSSVALPGSGKALNAVGKLGLQQAYTGLRHSIYGTAIGRLFSNKAGLYQFAMKDPQNFLRAVQYKTMVDGSSLDKVVADRQVTDFMNTHLKGLDPHTQKQLRDALEDKSLMTKIRRTMDTLKMNQTKPIQDDLQAKATQASNTLSDLEKQRQQLDYFRETARRGVGDSKEALAQAEEDYQSKLKSLKDMQFSSAEEYQRAHKLLEESANELEQRNANLSTPMKPREITFNDLQGNKPVRGEVKKPEVDYNSENPADISNQEMDLKNYERMESRAKDSLNPEKDKKELAKLKGFIEKAESEGKDHEELDKLYEHVKAKAPTSDDGTAFHQVPPMEFDPSKHVYVDDLVKKYGLNYEPMNVSHGLNAFSIHPSQELHDPTLNLESRLEKLINEKPDISVSTQRLGSVGVDYDNFKPKALFHHDVGSRIDPKTGKRFVITRKPFNELHDNPEMHHVIDSSSPTYSGEGVGKAGHAPTRLWIVKEGNPYFEEQLSSVKHMSEKFNIPYRIIKNKNSTRVLSSEKYFNKKGYLQQVPEEPVKPEQPKVSSEPSKPSVEDLPKEPKLPNAPKREDFVPRNSEGHVLSDLHIASSGTLKEWDALKKVKGKNIQYSVDSVKNIEMAKKFSQLIYGRSDGINISTYPWHLNEIADMIKEGYGVKNIQEYISNNKWKFDGRAKRIFEHVASEIGYGSGTKYKTWGDYYNKRKFDTMKAITHDQNGIPSQHQLEFLHELETKRLHRAERLQHFINMKPSQLKKFFLDKVNEEQLNLHSDVRNIDLKNFLAYEEAERAKFTDEDRALGNVSNKAYTKSGGYLPEGVNIYHKETDVKDVYNNKSGEKTHKEIRPFYKDPKTGEEIEYKDEKWNAPNIPDKDFRTHQWSNKADGEHPFTTDDYDELTGMISREFEHGWNYKDSNTGRVTDRLSNPAFHKLVNDVSLEAETTMKNLFPGRTWKSLTSKQKTFVISRSRTNSFSRTMGGKVVTKIDKQLTPEEIDKIKKEKELRDITAHSEAVHAVAEVGSPVVFKTSDKGLRITGKIVGIHKTPYDEINTNWEVTKLANRDVKNVDGYDHIDTGKKIREQVSEWNGQKLYADKDAPKIAEPILSDSKEQLTGQKFNWNRDVNEDTTFTIQDKKGNTHEVRAVDIVQVNKKKPIDAILENSAKKEVDDAYEEALHNHNLDVEKTMSSYKEELSKVEGRNAEKISEYEKQLQEHHNQKELLHEQYANDMSTYHSKIEEIDRIKAINESSTKDWEEAVRQTSEIAEQHFEQLDSLKNQMNDKLANHIADEKGFRDTIQSMEDKMNQFRDDSMNAMKQYELESEKAQQAIHDVDNTYQSELPKQLQVIKDVHDTLSSEEAFADYLELHFGDDLKKWDASNQNSANVGKHVLDTKSSIPDSAKAIIKEWHAQMNKIGQEEVSIGALKQGQLDHNANSYITHLLNDNKDVQKIMNENKLFFKSDGTVQLLPREKGDKSSFITSDYGFGQVFNEFGQERKITHIWDSNGNKIKNPTIDQINEAVRPLLHGNDLFKTNVGEIYLARQLKHNELMYDHKYMNEMMDTIGDKVDSSFVPKKGNRVVMNYGKFKESLHQLANINHILDMGELVSAHLRDFVSSLPHEMSDVERTARVNEEVERFSKETFTNDFRQNHYKEFYEKAFGALGMTKDGFERTATPMVQLNPEQAKSLTDFHQSTKLDLIDKINRQHGLSLDLQHIGKPINDLNERLQKNIDLLNNVDDLQIRQVHKHFVNQANNARMMAIARDGSKGLRMYDKFVHWTKLMQSTINPSFHTRNFMSNHYLNWLSVGGDTFDWEMNKAVFNTIRNAEDTAKLRSLPPVITNNGRVIHWDEMYDLAKAHGAVNEGFFAVDAGAHDASDGLIPKLGKWDFTSSKNFAPFKLGTEIGNRVENQARLLQFASHVKNGMSPKLAVEEVNKYLFDYNDVTSFERNVMKRIFPFYTWLRKNGRLQLTNWMENPTKYTMVNKMLNANNDMIDPKDRVKRQYLAPFAQDWVQTPFAINVAKTIGIGKNVHTTTSHNPVLWNPNMPYMDLDRVPDPTHITESIKNAISQSSVPIRNLTELATNKNFYFDEPIRQGKDTGSDMGAVANYLGNDVTPYSTISGQVTKTGANAWFNALNGLTGTKYLAYDYDRNKQQVIAQYLGKAKNPNNQLVDHFFNGMQKGEDTVHNILPKAVHNVQMDVSRITNDYLMGKDLTPSTAGKYYPFVQLLQHVGLNPNNAESRKWTTMTLDNLSAPAYSDKAGVQHNSNSIPSTLASFLESKLTGSDQKEHFSFTRALLGNDFASAEVTKSADGDSFFIKFPNHPEINKQLPDEGQEIRLNLIDTPETVKSGTPEEPYGKEASNYAKDVIPPGSSIRLVLSPHTDKYGRAVAYTIFNGQDGQQHDLGEEQLKQGFAKNQYWNLSENNLYGDKYAQTQTDAYDEKKGLWSIPGYSKNDNSTFWAMNEDANNPNFKSASQIKDPLTSPAQQDYVANSDLWKGYRDWRAQQDAIDSSDSKQAEQKKADMIKAVADANKVRLPSKPKASTSKKKTTSTSSKAKGSIVKMKKS